MWTDVVPWLLAPAGIVLGWWLNQLGVRAHAEWQAKQAAETAERQRVLDTARSARRMASLLHTLLYIRGSNLSVKGSDTITTDFNSARDEFRSEVLALRVLGPSWAVDGAERLDVETAKLVQLTDPMDRGVKREHITTINQSVPALERMVDEYVATISKHYNVAASDLPAPPDKEVEGRWARSDGGMTAPG